VRSCGSIRSADRRRPSRRCLRRGLFDQPPLALDRLRQACVAQALSAAVVCAGGVIAVNGWTVPLTFPNLDLFDKSLVVHEKVVLCPLLIRPAKTLLLRAKPRVPWKPKPVAHARRD
jgi:hypothetical protein